MKPFSQSYEKVVVKKHEAVEVLRELRGNYFGIDTETYGLDKPLFSIIISDAKGAYYFNFDDTPDYTGAPIPDEYILDKELFVGAFQWWQNQSHIWWAAHNAKFDMHKLFDFTGKPLKGSVWCTKTGERVYRNNYLDYSLAACAKRRGWAKNDKVEECIKQSKLYTWSIIPGKKKRDKWKHYDKVPFDIITKYGLHDGILHRELFLDQMRSFNVAI